MNDYKLELGEGPYVWKLSRYYKVGIPWGVDHMATLHLPSLHTLPMVYVDAVAQALGVAYGTGHVDGWGECYSAHVNGSRLCSGPTKG